MNNKKNQAYYSYFDDKTITGSVRPDSVPKRPTVPKQPVSKNVPRMLPSVDAYIHKSNQGKKAMEHILGGPIPNLPSEPSANNSQVFSHSPEAGMKRINQTLTPMANPSPFLPVMGEGQQGSNPSIQIDEAALFDQYADYYKRQGKLAMEDTIGRSASLTGGYGNSYAETAGNQAYDSYITEYMNTLRGISKSEGEDTTDGWLSGLFEDQTNTGFSGTTKQEAEAYLSSQGIPAEEMSELMTAGAWTIRKDRGTGGIEVTDFDTYAEYLAAFVAYAMETYSG